MQVSLLYANVSPDDILLKQKLDVLATSHPNLKVRLFQNVITLADLSKLHIFLKWIRLILWGQIFQVFYTVDNPSKSWRGGTGYISKDMAIKGLPGPSDDTLILVSVALMLQCFNFHMLIYFIMIWHQHKPAMESHSKCLFILSSIKHSGEREILENRNTYNPNQLVWKGSWSWPNQMELKLCWVQFCTYRIWRIKRLYSTKKHGHFKAAGVSVFNMWTCWWLSCMCVLIV